MADRFVKKEPWPAPAKINLFLQITGHRDDGYHDLQTVFQFLDVSDELEFQITEVPHITHTRPPPGIPLDNEICLQAASLLQRECAVSAGVEITLSKRIPQGGGLGGGSSDAATALVALNHLWRLGLSLTDLAGLGLRLGADVPVFILGRAAWAEGVGERLTEVFPEEPWYLLICPGVAVSTKKIFAQPELTRDSHPITIRAFLDGQARNTLESIVRKLYPDVDRALTWLADYGRPRMSGTGSCVFLKITDPAEGEEILAAKPKAWSGFITRGLNTSPLLARLRHEEMMGSAPG